MKNYKRIKIIGYFVILFVLSLNSCGANKTLPYESFVSDISNDGVAELTVEREVWGQAPYQKNNMANQTVVINGVRYNGVYQESYVGQRMSYETDKYKDEEKNMTFSLRVDTGEICGISFMNRNFFDTEPYLEDVDDPKETANAVAEKVAKQYLTDFDSYTRIEEEPYLTQEEKNGYTYSLAYYRVNYVRKIDDYYTSDFIRITVTSKGNIATIIMGDISVFSDIKLEVDDTKLSESIQKKVEEIYSTSELKLVAYEMKQQCIAKTPNGEVVVQSLITVTLKNDVEEFETAIALLTAI